MNEQVVSTDGRATRAIVRARDKRIGESPEEKAVNPRGSSCAFHCESRAHNLARFMANPSSREPASEATCVAALRDTSARNSPFPRYTDRHAECHSWDFCEKTNSGLSAELQDSNVLVI